MADFVLCIVILPLFLLGGWLYTSGQGAPGCPRTDQAALEQSLWASETKGAGWQLAWKDGSGAQAGPGLQREEGPGSGGRA